MEWLLTLKGSANFFFLLTCVIGNRRVKFEEFLAIFLAEKQKAKPVTAQQFIDTLSVFDKDNAGKVSSAELRHVLTALGKLGAINIFGP